MDEIQMRSYLGKRVSENLCIEAREALLPRAVDSSESTLDQEWQALLRATPPNTQEFNALVEWVIERWTLFQDIVRRVIRRVYVLMEFDQLGFLIIATFLIDGGIQWRIRRESFAYPSPLAHRASLWILSGLIAISAFELIAPLPFFPQLTPWVILLIAWALRAHITHLPKRL